MNFPVPAIATCNVISDKSIPSGAIKGHGGDGAEVSGKINIYLRFLIYLTTLIVSQASAPNECLTVNIQRMCQTSWNTFSYCLEFERRY